MLTNLPNQLPRRYSSVRITQTLMGYPIPGPSQSLPSHFDGSLWRWRSSFRPLIPMSPLARINLPPKREFPHDARLESARNFNGACVLRRISAGSRRELEIHASKGGEPIARASSSGKVVVVSSAVTVTLAIANRVLYKLALVPMKRYPFFLAQFTTFGYVVIYFSILYTRYRLGMVTDEMLALPKWRLLAVGMLEALGVAAGMSAGAMLPGPAIPLLSQTFLIWQLGFSAILLGRKYSFSQIFGCLLVAVGVVIAVSSGSGSSPMASGVDFIWPAVMIASSAFQAVASIIKESVFIDAASRLKGKSLDIFVVNSFGSGYQALFVLLLLPLLSNLRGIPFDQLPSYLRDGAGCFLNIGAKNAGCDGAPWLPLIYVATNIMFNISALNLVKLSSAVVSSLVIMLSVPMSIYILSLPLPYLPEGASLSPFFVMGTMILLLGLVLYNTSKPAGEVRKTS